LKLRGFETPVKPKDILHHNQPNVAHAMTAVPPIEIEHALVVRAADGDAAAFRRLFERHAPSVRRFVGDLLRDDAAADEATQETFVRAHSRLSSLRDGAKLLPWLFGIARNVAWEQRRARARGPQAEPPDDDASVDAAPTPEAILLGREADARLADALGALTDERRAVLLMRIDHDLGYDEIGEVMSWPLQKVKNEIHRARLLLRARLSEYLGGVS